MSLLARRLTVHGTGMMALILTICSFQSRLVPNFELKREIASAGPCFGQTSIAQLKGLDLISAERARELASAANSGVCVDEVSGKAPVRGPLFKIYAWPSQRDRATEVLFKDKEFNKEALELPGGENFEDPWLPKPNWIVPSVDSAVLKRAGIFDVVSAVVKSSIFSSVANKRRPNAVVIAERKPLTAFGKLATYDLYFRFEKAEVYRFQSMPLCGVFFAGRVDPVGTPFELIQEHPFTSG